MNQQELSLENAQRLDSVNFFILDFYAAAVVTTRIIRRVNTLSFIIRQLYQQIKRILGLKAQYFINKLGGGQFILLASVIDLNIQWGNIISSIQMQANSLDVFSLKVDPRAYRFFPKRQEQKSAFEKKGTRFFFYGQIEHDQYELRKLREFHQYIAKKQKVYDKDLFPNDQIVLQFLSANKYKPKDTLSAMKEHTEFRRKYLPNINPQRAFPILKKGFYYPCGRDKFFRPLLVFNLSLIDQKNIDIFYDAIIYTQQIVIDKFFLPGQVQSWSIIYDLAGVGISDLPMSAMKDMLGKISLNYGGRLHKLWIVNAPKGATTAWKIVSTFLDDITVQKIKLTKLNTEQTLFNNIDPSQVQVKYGGKQPNRTQYFPFTIPQGVFDQKRLLSDKQYEQLLKQGKLKNNTMDPLFTESK